MMWKFPKIILKEIIHTRNIKVPVLVFLWHKNIDVFWYFKITEIY